MAGERGLEMAGKQVVAINEKDNVGVVMEEVFAHDLLEIAVGDNRYTIEAKEPLARFHKVAISDIAKDAKVFMLLPTAK